MDLSKVSQWNPLPYLALPSPDFCMTMFSIHIKCVCRQKWISGETEGGHFYHHCKIPSALFFGDERAKASYLQGQEKHCRHEKWSPSPLCKTPVNASRLWKSAMGKGPSSGSNTGSKMNAPSHCKMRVHVRGILQSPPLQAAALGNRSGIKYSGVD